MAARSVDAQWLSLGRMKNNDLGPVVLFSPLYYKIAILNRFQIYWRALGHSRSRPKR